MPRKKNTKPTSTEKKHTAVPPGSKPDKAKPDASTPVPAATPAVTPTVAAVDPKVLKELSSASASERANAATAIGKSQNVAAVKPLLNSLRDLDAEVAREAATALGLLGDASAVEPLIEIVNNTQGYFHSVVRSAAAVSLAQLKDHRAADALLNAIYDPIADPSSEAIRAIVALGDRRAVSALIEVVRNRNGFFANSVRRAAVLGLIKLGGPEAQAEIRFVSANAGEDWVIREEATSAISAG